MPWPSRSNLGRDLGLALLAVVAVTAASGIGQLATYPNLAPWYSSLAKPAFNPPNWIFAPVWTTLYVLMAVAAWRILRVPSGQPGRGTALLLFFVQLVLNAAWSWMFFGAVRRSD
jgi:translocator protein